MRNLLALVLIIMFFPNRLDHSHVLPVCSLPSHSLEYYIDALISNPMIFDANSDLGYEDNMFSMLGGNVDNFMFLGYFSRYNASIDPHYMYLVDEPRKLMWNSFFNFSVDFSIVLGLMRRALTFFNVLILMLSLCHACESHIMAFDKLLRALIESNVVG